MQLTLLNNSQLNYQLVTYNQYVLAEMLQFLTHNTK